MKLYIMADLEGATAVTGGWSETNPGCREFEHARQMITGDINACARGAFDAGATDIVVFDGHGMALSVDPLKIDPELRLIQGRAMRPSREKPRRSSLACIPSPSRRD